MRIKFELNEKEFVIRIVQNTKDNTKPGYICESDDDAVIYSTTSEVINENYKKNFDKTTRYSGPSVLGFDDETFIEQLQVGVLFFPFEIIINGITVFVASLGSSDEEELNFAGPGYCSSFNHKYSGKKSLMCQSMCDTECQIDIWGLFNRNEECCPKIDFELMTLIYVTHHKEQFWISNHTHLA